MSYKLWFADYMVALRRDRKTGGHEARSAVFQATDEGKYGKQVRFSVFGIGEPSSLIPWMMRNADEEKKLMKDMAFYAQLE